MALTALSTVEEIIAAYKTNAGYEFEGTNGSVAMAQAFVIACRYLILVMPKIAQQDRASLTLSPDLINQQIEQARQFIGASGGNDVRHFSFQNLRGAHGTTAGTGGA